MGACLKEFADEARALVAGENKDLCLREFFAETTKNLRPVQIWEHDIQNDKVRFLFEAGFAARQAIPALDDHLKDRLINHCLADHLADSGLVFNDGNGLHARWGNSEKEYDESNGQNKAFSLTYLPTSPDSLRSNH